MAEMSFKMGPGTSLSAATLAYRPLYLAELAIVSGLPAEISGDVGYVRDIVALCGSFLTVKDGIVYLIHQSAKDYLGGRAAPAIFPFGPEQVHRGMFARSGFEDGDLEIISRFIFFLQI
jgi:hypothetical protein